MTNKMGKDLGPKSFLTLAYISVHKTNVVLSRIRRKIRLNRNNHQCVWGHFGTGEKEEHWGRQMARERSGQGASQGD